MNWKYEKNLQIFKNMFLFLIYSKIWTRGETIKINKYRVYLCLFAVFFLFFFLITLSLIFRIQKYNTNISYSK